MYTYSAVLVTDHLVVRRTIVQHNANPLMVEQFRKTFTCGFGFGPRYQKECGENVWNSKFRVTMVFNGIN